MNDIKRKLYSAIETDKEELYNLLSSLVKINSENFGSCGNEEECSEFIGEYFKKMGFECDVYSPLEIKDIENHPDYLPGRGLENRKNASVVVGGKTVQKI